MFSVVVPAYNEEKTISRCLKPLAAQECELIIVVGGNDNTAKVAKKYGKVVLDKKCVGAGAARNLGAKKAGGDVVLFTDGDTVVPKNWVSKYEQVFQKKKIVGVGGVVKPFNPKLVDKIIFRINQDLLYRLTAALGFYQLSGNNCGYRKKEFLAVGGFDEEMSMLEDTELPMRMKKKGLICFDKTIFVKTSPRRMREKGYCGTWLHFMKEYINWFVFKKKPRSKYFKSSNKAKTY